MSKDSIVKNSVKRELWPPEAKLCEVIYKLGALLQDSTWWDRYHQIASKMGCDCILSVKTATSMFQNEVNINEIKQKLKELATIIDGIS